jgi:hypothetical protein
LFVYDQLLRRPESRHANKFIGFLPNYRSDWAGLRDGAENLHPVGHGRTEMLCHLLFGGDVLQ